MSARQKLEEAEFYLHKLRDLQSLPQDIDVQKELKYYLSAFLSASASVREYLLEDFNIRFRLNIPLTEKLYPDKFEEQARSTGNQAALQFIQWWREQSNALKKDPIGCLLIDKRHIAIHRVQVRPDLAKITAKETLHLSESVQLRVFREGKLMETYKSAEQPPPSSKETETSFNWFFSEYPSEDIISICIKYLDKLTSFVSEAEKKFP